MPNLNHDVVEELEAEIERLRAALEYYAKNSMKPKVAREALSIEAADEIERLRAALERIAKDAPFSRYRAWEYQTIAREALRDE